MNWNFIFWKLLPVFLGFVLIYGSFSFAKWNFRRKQMKATKAASYSRKIWILLEYLVIGIIICGCLGYKEIGKGNYSYFFIYSAQIILPALIGLYVEIKRDAKLTSEERTAQYLKMKIEDRETDNYPPDY